MKTKMLRLAVLSMVTTLGLGSYSAVSQNNTAYEQALRELDIMSNIFEAASDQRRNNRDENREDSRYDFDEALYLADQGMLFTFRMRSGPGFFPEMNFSLGGMPIEAIAEISRDINDGISDLQREMFFIGGRSFGGLSEEQLEEMEIMSEEMEERQDNIRDLQRDLRDMQRDLRDMQREARNNDDNEQLEAEIAALEAQLDAEREQLETQSDQYRLFMDEFRQARQEELTARNQVAVNEIMNTLCDYGATLRSLDDDEHVTIILENFNDNLDQLYVFDFADVAACSSGENLLQSALSYQL